MPFCQRCGRDSHLDDNCYATKDIDGKFIEESESESEIQCERCGRESHTIEDCYATKDIDGNLIEDEYNSGVYVLKLGGGNFYVGKSDDIKSRISQHENGSGASWTKMHSIVRQVDPITPELDDFESWERAETLELAHIHGIEKVRGHAWTQISLTESKKREFIQNIRERKDLCRKCGSPDHMISSCRKRKTQENEKKPYSRFKKNTRENL